MHDGDTKGVQLASQRLKDITSLWYEQWEEARGKDATPTEWDEFMNAIIDQFYPIDLMQVKSNEFVNLKRGIMSRREYNLKFTQLSHCALEMVSDMRAIRRKFC